MELTTRIISALVFGPTLIAIVWFAEPLPFALFVSLLAAVGSWEWLRLAGSSQPLPRTAFAFLTGACVLALVHWGSPEWAHLLLVLAAGVWMLNIFWLTRGGWLAQSRGPAFWVKTCVGAAVIVCACFSLAGVHRAPAGAGLTLVFLLIIWGADIGAYAAGRLFGRHKLAPTISPGKTWEGVAGGQLLVAFIVWLLLRYAPDNLRIDAWLYVLAALTAALSVIGDLFVSLLKRQQNVKDTGRLMPGHGGALDRFDSVFAAAPLFLAGLTWAGRI